MQSSTTVRMRRSHAKKTRKAPTVASVTKVVNRVLHKSTEPKYIAVNQAFTGIDYTGQMTSLTDIAQGNAQSQRIGDELRLRSLDLHYQLVCADANNCVRVIVFQWFMNTNPQAGNILYNVGTAQAVMSGYGFENRKNYRILYDKYVMMNLVTAATYAGRARVWKIPRRNQVFTTTGTTTGENKLYLLIISDSAAVPNPTASFNYKVNYSDS